MNDTLTVLVVDDEPGMLKGAERTLREFAVRLPDVNGDVRFRVEVAGSGEEALARIEQSPPQIMLLDYKLPGISGLDVLQKLAGRDLELLTIMITAYASLETAVLATKQGAYDFLAKPFTPAELKNVVRKAAGRVVLARQAKQLAEERRKIRFQFISVLAHELKAPLGAVEGYLQIMKDRAAGADMGAYDGAISRSLVRLEGMRKLILDLLDLTRIESGQKQRVLAKVDVREVAAAAREGMLSQAAQRKIEIAIAAEGPVEMDADRGEIEIILNNLVSNAVKYNRDGGRVDVAIAADEGSVTVRVRDTGIGMTAEESARLFNDFVRIKNDKTRNIMGSGLGLSIVKKLAMLYGGDVSVKSEPGVGSTFTVLLGRRATA